jgi:hypothetical protein
MSADIYKLPLEEPARRVKYVAFANVDPHPIKKWLVGGFLGEDETSAEFGMPGTAKSVYALDLGLHIASNREWFGRRVSQGAVLYVAAERVGTVHRRAAAWRHFHGIDKAPLYISGESFDLCKNAKDAEAIIRCGKEIEQEAGCALRLIVIDTVSRVLNGGDENSGPDMGSFLINLGRIQKGTEAHVMAIHHTPHGHQRLRGHGSLLGGLDTTISMEKSQAGHIASLDKSNDGPEGATMTFRLESVELSIDADTGQRTDAPVVIPIENDAKRSTSTRKKPLKTTHELALRALKERVEAQGVPVPFDWGLPAGINAIASEQWADLISANSIVDPTAKRARQQIYEIKNSLKLKNLINERDGWLWVS